MVKPKVVGETKEEKFKRIAGARVRKILEILRVLGNCSNTANYKYNEEQIQSMFNEIEAKLNETRNKFLDELRLS